MQRGIVHHAALIDFIRLPETRISIGCWSAHRVFNVFSAAPNHEGQNAKNTRVAKTYYPTYHDRYIPPVHSTCSHVYGSHHINF